MSTLFPYNRTQSSHLQLSFPAGRSCSRRRWGVPFLAASAAPMSSDLPPCLNLSTLNPPLAALDPASSTSCSASVPAPTSASQTTPSVAASTAQVDLPQPLSPPRSQGNLPPPPSSLLHSADSPSRHYPFPPSTLESALQTPPLDHQLGAHVAHLIAHKEGPAHQVLAELLGVPQELTARLIWFGAVYYCPVPPLPPPLPPPSSPPSAHAAAGPSAGGGGSDRKQLAAAAAAAAAADPASDASALPMPKGDTADVFDVDVHAVRQAALVKWGRHSKHQTPRRLTDPATPLSTGGYLRAHTHPKRFPAAHRVSPEEWAARLLAVRHDHVVVNKPPGLQVPPTVDNLRESLLSCVEKALSLPAGSLLPAHRLDAGTEGVVVLARDKAFASYFRVLMADKAQHAVRKQYKCLVPGHPPLGTLEHWLLEDQRQPGEAAHSVVVTPGTLGAARAELRVEQVEAVQLGVSAVEMWGVAEAYEATITLVTGRTHQIRVQMAALGLPLLGDRLYSALAAKWQQQQQQHPEQQQQQQQQQAVRGRALDWCLPALQNPLAPVALQAYSLTVLEDGPMGRPPVCFSAGEPWWRR